MSAENLLPYLNKITTILLVITLTVFLNSCMMTQKVYAESLMGNPPSRTKTGASIAIDVATFPAQILIKAAQETMKESKD